VAGMNNTINSFYAKGKKNFTIFMPCAITNIEKMIMQRANNARCLIVGLNNGEVRLYTDKYLITTIRNDVSYFHNLNRILLLHLNLECMEGKKVV
jgi:hypothetical protein